MRYDKHVKPLLEPYRVNVLGFTEYDEKTHSGVRLTVSKDAAKWVEYLLCRSGRFSLLSTPLEPRNIEWARKWQEIPVQRGCNGSSEAGVMGRMPRSWASRAKEEKQQQGDWLGGLRSLFADQQPQEQPRRQRTQRRAKRQRRGRR